MKLYDVPRKTYIKIGDTKLFFDHIDGMYSYCKDMKGNIVHPASFTDVEIDEEAMKNLPVMD